MDRIQLADGVSWAVSLEGTHINLLEMEALYLAINLAVRDIRGHGKRLLAMCDSQVVIGATAKGRSSARALASRLKRLSALLLAAGLLLGLRYIK